MHLYPYIFFSLCFQRYVDWVTSCHIHPTSGYHAWDPHMWYTKTVPNPHPIPLGGPAGGGGRDWLPWQQNNTASLVLVVEVVLLVGVVMMEGSGGTGSGLVGLGSWRRDSGLSNTMGTLVLIPYPYTTLTITEIGPIIAHCWLGA